MNDMRCVNRTSLAVSTVLLVGGFAQITAHAADVTQPAQDEWKFTLKNAYIDRDYDNDNVKDTGSWSQAASLFYKSKMNDTPLQIADKPITIGVDASVQYAVRLSKDKHVADTVLPFNKQTQSQASDFLKYGATLKLGYNKSLFNLGELWLDLPVTSLDGSRQLLTSYWGANLKTQVNDQLYAELGRVEKASTRAEEGFHNFAFTSNGKTHYSDGLNYINLQYQVNPAIKAEYYYGNLEDIFNKHYVGLEHIWKKDKVSLSSKLKYFNAKDDGHALDIDAQNIGLIETLKVKNHTFGLGYQQITGDTAYPLPDGFLPETYFINWNTNGFYKQDEKSYHFIYGYDFKDYVPGFSAIVKYVYGDSFKAADGSKNKESESDVLLKYEFQQPYLKGLSLQYLRLDYKIKNGNDYGEDRLFVSYTKKF